MIKSKASLRVLSLILALVALMGSFSAGGTTAFAANKTPVAAYAAVKNAYGSSFPLYTNNRISGRSNVLGVTTANCSSYYAAQRFSSNSKEVYEIFICKAKSGKKGSIKSQLKKHLKNEKGSMNNYLSAKGKKLFSHAKVGTVGSFVYMVMVDTSKNKKAVKAIKKTLK